MKVSKRIKRLVVNVTEEEHLQMKVMAAKKNLTISKMVLQSIALYLEKFFPNGK